MVGTAGATTLPNHVVQMVIQKGGIVLDINIEQNIFGDLAKQNKGFSLIGPSGTILPELLAAL